MRYTKWALLLFGAGLVFGLAVVSVPLPNWARAASLTMAGGIALLPLAAVLDWRRRSAAPAKRRPRKAAARRRPAQRRPGGTSKAKRK
jgi:hypothetical protein